jgi:hypothetical protein
LRITSRARAAPPPEDAAALAESPPVLPLVPYLPSPPVPSYPSPVHSSWLNQAESLIEAFGYYYLKRGSWRSRAEFIEPVTASGPEYNER